jgi:molecular chaperone HscB
MPMPDADKRSSMQWATRANEAFLTLKKPLERAKYLLELAGTTCRRKAIPRCRPISDGTDGMARGGEEARLAAIITELEQLHQPAAQRHREVCYDELGEELDDGERLGAGSGTVRRLMFLEKLNTKSTTR